MLQPCENMLYKTLIRPILFKLDAENVHDMATNLGEFIGNNYILRKLGRAIFYYESPMLNSNVAGIEFPNPVGLAAGFDKNARLYKVIPALGFGFAELGSITGEKCPGNPRPRLFRLPKDKSIIVNFGLCNNGAEEISRKLNGERFEIPIGISIAKTNDPEIKDDLAVMDYVKSFKLLHKIGDYTAINVSCPNTSDGRTFCHPDNMQKLLTKIGKCEITKPVFIKVTPDLTNETIDKIIGVVKNFKFISGFVISNLTHDRSMLQTDKKKLEKMPHGGISGMPAQKISDDLVKTFYERTKGKYAIIGVGGIFTAEDAYRKIRNGASLVQLITGLVYEGPEIIKKINKGIVELLKRDNLKNISEAVGLNS